MGSGGSKDSKSKSKSEPSIKTQLSQEKQSKMDGTLNNSDFGNFSQEMKGKNLEIEDMPKEIPQNQPNGRPAPITLHNHAQDFRKRGSITNSKPTTSSKNTGLVSGFNQNRDIDNLEEMILDSPVKNKLAISTQKSNVKTPKKEAPFFKQPEQPINIQINHDENPNKNGITLIHDQKNNSRGNSVNNKRNGGIPLPKN